jgi:hypothetical protein
MEDTHETQRAQVAAFGRMKTCKHCGESKPLTEEHFHQQWRVIKSGERRSHGWNTVCKPCSKAKFQAYWDGRKAADKQAAKEGRAPTPPVVRALNRVAPSTLNVPKKPNLRAILEAEAEANYEKLAKKLVKQALGESKESAGALKLVFSYILGTPKEASDDHGPTEFWHSLLASARAVHAGSQTDLDPPDGDLADGESPD